MCDGHDDNLDSDLDNIADGCDICPYDSFNSDEYLTIPKLSNATGII